MEDSDILTGSLTIENGGEEEERAERMKSSFFAELKPYCLELLELLQHPKEHSFLLPSFLHFLRSSSSDSLQPFFDYTLFPLLLILDAAIECRSTHKAVSQDKITTLSEPKTPYEISDNVAEGVVQCLEQLLKKCHLESVDQMVMVLKKITYGAMLSPSEASEEFRGGVIKCFQALLLNLAPCTDESCSCKHILGVPELSESQEFLGSFARTSKFDSKQRECLVAFFHSESASAAVGHWLSLLLKIADTEAGRGHRGSARLRVEAFMTLRIFVAKVSTVDALAFFLPGVVSQFAKVLHVSKTMISGAAGSSEAIDQAIRGLAEYLMIVLQDDANLHILETCLHVDGLNVGNRLSTYSILEELRHLPVKTQILSKADSEHANVDMKDVNVRKSESKERSIGPVKEGTSLRVNRTKDWIETTSANVSKFLSATLPQMCTHPAKRVREGGLAAIQGLLSKCRYTMKESRMMLLESLCVLAVDESDEVSAAAQNFLETLFASRERQNLEDDVASIFSRLIEKLPKSVLASDESLALSQAQQLLVVMYYSGPLFVVHHLLQSPVMAAQFLDVLAFCMGQNSVFTGSLDKVILARPTSKGYLQSVAELKTGTNLLKDSESVRNASPTATPNITSIQDGESKCLQENVQRKCKLPRMPPWFISLGSHRLYEALAGIVRLVGLALVADLKSDGKLSVITDIPLGYLRKLICEVRLRESGKESWQSWYNRTGSGQLLRQASTAVCILNEMIYGLSDESVVTFMKIFQKSKKGIEECEPNCANDWSHSFKHTVLYDSVWKIPQGKDAKNHVTESIGRILHEYISQEVWDLPNENKSSMMLSDAATDEISLHFLSDTAILHQVIIEGIGVFNICLGRDFVFSGFLHSSLYLLLENLISSNFQVRSASDCVLRILTSTCGHSTVGDLVLANADFIIDSICRQLRHLDLNPHVPSVLATMLSYIGVAHKILPLLEEPMLSVSKELEVLGRHQHPSLTIPFLKAVLEITKASKREAKELPSQAESFAKDVQSDIADFKPREGTGAHFNGGTFHEEKWENILFQLHDTRRYRRTVGSIIGSSLVAAIPLLGSSKQAECMVALDIVEDGILALAKVEEAYKHEKEAKEAIQEMLEACLLYQLRDTLDAADDGSDENRLLPAMNKIWPLLVVCVQNKSPVVVRKCSSVVSRVVEICGGDFFTRRFHCDGSHFWKLLTSSPFQKKPISKEEKTHLQLPYRSSLHSEDSTAEVSNLKVQAAVLNMIADLSRNKRSCSALELVFKKVSGLVVGIACSGVRGLRDAALNALQALATVDPDLVWLLLADVYCSLKEGKPSSSTSEFPDISQILPPPLSAKGYLYVQYGGQTYGFDIDHSSVETVFRQLHSQVFTNQVYM